MSSLEKAAAGGALEKTAEIVANTLRRTWSFMYQCVGAPSMKKTLNGLIKCQSIFDGIYDVESFEDTGVGDLHRIKVPITADAPLALRGRQPGDDGMELIGSELVFYVTNTGLDDIKSIRNGYKFPGQRSNFPPAPGNMIDFKDGKKLIPGSRFFDTIKDATDGYENYSNVAYARHAGGNAEETWTSHCPSVITHEGFVKMLIATFGKVDTKFCITRPQRMSDIVREDENSMLRSSIASWHLINANYLHSGRLHATNSTMATLIYLFSTNSDGEPDGPLRLTKPTIHKKLAKQAMLRVLAAPRMLTPR